MSLGLRPRGARRGHLSPSEVEGRRPSCNAASRRDWEMLWQPTRNIWLVDSLGESEVLINEGNEI
jgi:hypothetical protein